MKNSRYSHHREKKPEILRFIINNHDIRKQFLITLGLVVLHRLLLNIPIPFLPNKLVEGQAAENAIYTIIEFADMLSAGGLLKTSILGLGLLPFKLSDQVIGLLVEFIPALKYRLEENKYQAKNLLKRWKLYLAIPFGLLEGFVFLNMSVSDCSGVSLFKLGLQYGFLERLVIVLILAAGSFITYWICELISEFGLKDMGSKVLVLCGILSRIPSQLISLSTGSSVVTNYVIFILEFLISLIIIIYCQKAVRNISVMFPGRRVGTRMSMPVKSKLPIKIWSSGMDGFIGSQLLVSITTFCATLAICADSPTLREAAGVVISFFLADNPFFGPITFISVILFAYLTSYLSFEESEYGSRLKQVGAVIPGIQRGDATKKFLGKICKRLSLIGGVAFGLLAIFPWIANLIANTDLSLLNGEKILIVVTSMIDITSRLESEMLMRDRTGFLG